MADRTYYEILGVSTNATTGEIKSAYRRLAIQHHPDSFSSAKRAAESTGDSDLIRILREKIRGSEEEFKLINEAHDALSDENQRRKYDAGLMARSSMPTSSSQPPDIRISRHVFDFGVMESGAHKKASFFVTNEGGPIDDLHVEWQPPSAWISEIWHDNECQISVHAPWESGRHIASLKIMVNGKRVGTVVFILDVPELPQSTFDTYMDGADFAASENRWDDAIRLYSSAIDMYPNHPRIAEAYVGRGYVQYYAGAYQEAAEDLLEGLSRDSQYLTWRWQAPEPPEPEPKPSKDEWSGRQRGRF